MSRRRPVVTLCAALLLASSLAAAQGASGLVVIRALTPDGAVARGALVELSPVSDTGLARSAQVADTMVAWPVFPATYRLRVTLAGTATVERTLAIASDTVTTVEVRLAPGTPPVDTVTITVDRSDLARQTTFPARMLDGLPSARTLQSLAETAHPFLIADRIDGGGLWTGEVSRLGAGSSATQTTYRVDGLDVSDPLATGTPLFHADLGVLQEVGMESANLDPAAAGPGPIMTMVLRRPGDSWSGSAQFLAAPGGWQSDASEIAPIARLESWTDGSLVAGGPLAPGYGLFASGRVTDGEHVEREQPGTLDGGVRSLTAHLVGGPRPGEQLRVIGAFADITRPLASRARFADRDLDQRDRQLVVSATWERARDAGTWSVSAAYQRASSSADVSPTAPGGRIERLLDGPPLGLADPLGSRRQRWDLGADVAPATRRWLGREHGLQMGAGLGGASAVGIPGPQPTFAELVNGRPARVWDVSFRGAETRWTSTAAYAWVSDRIALADTVTLTAALRLELDRGSADGGSNSISWFNGSPRVAVRWAPARNGRFAVTTGYGWYRHRLPLGYFAVGDPAGSSGVMYRWDDLNGDGAYTTSELTAVAHVGLCCAGAEPNGIADDLRRPTTGEFHVGFEQAIGSWRWGITGIDRRERQTVALVNTGVTVEDYAVTYIQDPGVDVAGLQGFNPLPIYDRLSGSLLRDRYALVNAPVPPSRFQSFEVTLAREAGERWYFRFGGSAYRSEGVGANRGYRPDENDQGLLGEVFTTPNAATSARGRLFYDRAFVMKMLGAYSAPGPFRASFIARYQDGQPFSRVVLAEGLNQGTEVIQAYPRGGQRFTFTATLDTRVEWQFPPRGRRAVGLTVDVFNLLNMANEVEEDVVGGAAFRTISAVQPPRVVRVGVRLTF